MKNIFTVNKLFISFFLFVAILINMVTFSFGFTAKNTTPKDNAILARFFSSSDMYLKDISKVFQNNAINSKTQTNPVKNNLEKTIFSDVIFTEHFSFVNYMSAVYFSLIVLFLFLFYFNLIFFDFDIWRSIVFLLIFKMLFNILPRSISIKALLNNISLCFIY